jgi:cytochrome c5
MVYKVSLWAFLSVTTAVLAFGSTQNDKTEKEKEPEGKIILDKACTVCHDLKEVEKFKGFYKREDWQDVVTTMIKYGADVKEAQVPVLVEYLTQTYSSK